MAKNNNALPSAEIIAKFDTYEAAAEHVDRLINGDFPARQIAIVGRGVRSVERVRGRLGYPRLALTGAFNGVLIALLVITFSPPEALTNIPGTLVTLIGLGVLVNVLRLSFAKNKRTFISQNSLIADTYEVQVPRDLKAQSEEALEKLAAKTKPAK
jgi:hypothetical protein